MSKSNKKRQLRKADRHKVKGLHGRIKHVMSNFRLSLTFRIALHYAWQLLRTTLLTMLIVSVVCFSIAMIDVDNTVRRIKAADTLADAAFSPAVIQNAAITHAELLPLEYRDSDLPLLAFCITDIGE